MNEAREAPSVFRSSIESLDQTRTLAESMAAVITTPFCIGLDGTLGAGKTQWTRYLSVALGADDREVTSPTFMLVHTYATQPKIYHLDAYRIRDDDEFLELGVEEMFQEDAITIVEWSNRVQDCLPDERWMMSIEVVSRKRGKSKSSPMDSSD